ncbi:MAG: peptidylprolyl isomerase [Caldisericia bacterium]
MEEEKKQVFDEIEEPITGTTDGSVGESDSSGTAENKGNSWILWVMGVVLLALIAFLVFYIVGKPASDKGSNGNLPDNNISSISIEAGDTLAKVGDREITDGDATERAILIIAQTQQMSPEQLDLEDPQIVAQLGQAKNYALGQMVQEIIFEEYAKKEGLKVSDNDIAETALLTIDAQIKPYVLGKEVSKWDENDQQQWDTWLASQGFGSDEDLKNDFVMRYPAELTTDTYKRKLYGEELENIKVSETEARSWFEAPGRIRVAHILYSYNPENDPKELEKEARENAEKARLTALSDSDFLSLAFDVSEDPTVKQNRGDLGWYTVSNGTLVSDQGGRFVTEFEQAALRLRLGEISPVVQTQFGFT